SLFSIKECMTCGALYTRNYGCSKGSLEDKILVPIPDSSQQPPQNCATCGNPVNGLNCRSCAFVRKCLNEGWYTIRDENENPNTSESSKDNTNVVSAPRESFIVNQDPGINPSQSPPQSNHNCCYKCGDSLDDIFCQRCTCKSCGNGAHIGYNCPPKALIISNPEQCNQTINELPQTLPSVHPTCNYEDKNSFTYDSKLIIQDVSSVFHPPSTAPCMALLLAEERFLKIKQTMREEPNQLGVMQELLLKLMDDLQILKGSQQEKKETAAQSFTPYWDVSMIDDEEARDNFLKDERFGKIKDALMNKQYQQEDIQELMSKLLEDVRNISEEFLEYINCPRWNRPLFYFDDDDDEYTVIWRRPKAITPDEPSEDPEDPLIMGEEELSTILEKDKSSVENLNPLFDSNDDFTSSDDESLSDKDVLMENFKIYSNPLFDDDEIISTKIDPHSFNAESNLIESLLNRDTLIDFSPKFDFLLEEFSGELAHIDPIPPGIEKADFDLEEEIRLVENLSYDNTILESLSPSPIPVMDSDSLMEEIDLFLTSDDLMPPGIENDDYDSEGDIRSLKELLINHSLPFPENESSNLDDFNDLSSPCPLSEPPDVEISLIIETDAPVINNFDKLNEDEYFDPGGDEIDVEDNDSFTFVIRTFLLFLTYLMDSPFLYSFGSKDTIFDPGIST
ncbi:hypothetical protein Tco_0804482, partial [Tanacetum coccineum]